MSTIQGNFLSPDVQALARQFLAEAAASKTRHPPSAPPASTLDPSAAESSEGDEESTAPKPIGIDAPVDVVTERLSYIELERASAAEAEAVSAGDEVDPRPGDDQGSGKTRRGTGRMVDVRFSPTH